MLSISCYKYHIFHRKWFLADPNLNKVTGCVWGSVTVLVKGFVVKYELTRSQFCITFLFFYAGVCRRCRKTISGEGNGCTAMGDMYHVTCFVCEECRKLNVFLQLLWIPNYIETCLLCATFLDWYEKSAKLGISKFKLFVKPAFTCSKSAVETSKQCGKSTQG